MSLSTLVKQLRQIAAEGETALGESSEMEAAPSYDHPAPVAKESATAGKSLEIVPAAPRPAEAAAGGWWVWILVGAAVLSLVGAGVFFLVRKSPKPAGGGNSAVAPSAVAPSVPAAPVYPEVLRRRSRVLQQQPAEEEEEQEEQTHTPPAQPEFQQANPSMGEPRRHVRFDEEVTEYPIPARRISRRAGAATVEEPGPPDMGGSSSVPQIRIDMSQRFEG
jgi:hypothetical protein